MRELTAPSFAPGHVVAERYEVLEIVGRGTTGTVYRARDLDVDPDAEIVALKAIHPHLHADRQISGRVRREVEILQRLEGPHVCKLFDYVEEDGLVFLTLEYVDGPSLDAYLAERGTLPLSEVIELTRQICSALEQAHQAGIIHRDLKPSNVLVEGVRPPTADDAPPPSFLAELTVRVVDFGLAKIVAGDQVGTALTEQDMIFGTPDYMSPEQVSGADLDHRCDVYAAAVMLYEMTVGEPPFDRATALGTMTAHLEEPVPSPREQATGHVPKRLEGVILRAMSKDPDERFATAREMADALGTINEPDTDRDPEPSISDTQVENAETAIHTTLPSHHDEPETEGNGAAVRVVVRGEQSSHPPERHSSDRASSPTARSTHPPASLGTDEGERRLWAVITLIAAVAAVAAGVMLGSR